MVQIARAIPDDCERLANIFLDAFDNTVISQRLFGNVARRDHVEHAAARFTKRIASDKSEMFKAVITQDDGSEKIVGLAYWDLPKTAQEIAEKAKEDEGKTDEQKREEAKKNFPPGTDLDSALEFFGRLDPKVDEPFYHLHLLGIDPYIQRTGAGSKLLKWGCREADRAGVATFLEATDVGMGLYRKFGFEDFGEPITGGENNEMVVWPMRRPPLELRTFRRSDFPAMCEIYFEAFRPTTIWRYNFENVTRQASDRAFKRRLENWFDEIDNDGNTANDKHEVIVAKRGDKVLGFAVWSKVPEKSQRKENKTPFILPEGANAERTIELITMIHEASDQYEKKHWYLGLLTIHPTAQGKGVGESLLEWGIERAKQDGSDIVLGSTEFGRALYKKFGFVDYGEPVVATQDSSVKNWPMVLSL
ncbi:uncharacterized protein JCM15063_000490 [Sporobolomyces koalae]|uniref:uncharacterized protein n=1 Tax=Sporobolomyces koalae TaxID=500713 RepID=UPI00317C2986